jgi:hypothetical protein
MELTVLDFASAAGVCDGEIEGIFAGFLSGNDVAGGAFWAPLPVAADEIDEPSCRPVDAACTRHDQCCSESCFLVIGVCN